ncbi:hypothetical protein ES703_76811 [subsurface metagenome]
MAKEQKTYLGIDCGSVSIKFALLRGDELVGKAYLKNKGLISTVQEGLRQLPKARIDGVGVTGSGKEFVKSLVGGDYTANEIISHVVASLKEHPDVKTILDIGGEDSKLMLVRGGVLADFQMNRDCGGGTGSMIETIANRLGVKIEDVGGVCLGEQRSSGATRKVWYLLSERGSLPVKQRQTGRRYLDGSLQSTGR